MIVEPEIVDILFVSNVPSGSITERVASPTVVKSVSVELSTIT